MPPLRVRGIPVSFETTLDAMSLLFTMGVGLACGLLFGAAPAVQMARADAQNTLRAGASTPPRSQLRNTLMAVEVALAVTVLVAAGLFLRSFYSTRTEDPGFRRDGVLLAGYDLSGRGLKEAAVKSFSANLLERLRQVTGIADLRMQQPFDQPKLDVEVDRVKAQQAGFSQREVASNLLITSSGSFQKRFQEATGCPTNSAAAAWSTSCSRTSPRTGTRRSAPRCARCTRAAAG